MLDTVVVEVERLRLKEDWEGVLDVLIRDTVRQEFPSFLRAMLEGQAHVQGGSDDERETLEPAAKRRRIRIRKDPLLHPPHQNQTESFRDVPLGVRLCLCNAVCSVVHGMGLGPAVWSALDGTEPRHIEYLFYVCGEVLQQQVDLNQQHLLNLKDFVTGVCTASADSETLLRLLRESSAKSLVLAGKKEAEGSDHGGCKAGDGRKEEKMEEGEEEEEDLMSTMDHGSLVNFLEKEVLFLSTPSSLVRAVEKLLKSVPQSEHRAIAQNWKGSGRGFASLDLIPDPPTLLKCNALLLKCHQLRQAKAFKESLEFLRDALKLLLKTSPECRNRMEPFLQEQILTLELLSAQRQLRESLTNRESVSSVPSAGLIGKTKLYYEETENDTSLNPESASVAGAFLFNLQLFSVLSNCEHSLVPGRVAPRLARAVLSKKENKDMRKPTRDLFEAVFSVFSLPMSATESKADRNERQLQLRTYFHVFVENLLDVSGLSFLVAALVRIWTMVKKPEEEVVTEHMTNWPTAIGNSDGIGVEYVFDCLCNTLDHALELCPDRSPWVTTQGDLFMATGQFGTALQKYLHAGALESNFFEEHVPETTWTQQIYRKIIKCCSSLGYHTHSVIFCQLLSPVDYKFVFNILQNHSSSAVEPLFQYLWDMTIIEYVIYIHAKRGESHKQMAAVQIAGQSELNINNSSEALRRAVDVRRRCFLRDFYRKLILT